MSFYVEDPKLRHIHKASVRDRVLYQAVFGVLYRIFDEHFIFDSYSSRNGKGTHAGNERVEKFLRKATANWTHRAYALKCDVRKFFDSIDHEILFSLIQKKVGDQKTLALVRIVLKSFEKSAGKGLPLGNVTSQLFANIYMNEFDQYAKHELKAKWYARYCDDFVIVDRSRETLEMYIPKIREFLLQKLALDLHPNKISLRKARQGIDFLGYVILPHRKVLRIKTENRMLEKVTEKNVASYKGMLSHCKGKRIENQIDKMLQK
ncbi:MAG TPA: reverse transcriptase/maturase family protein [Candidatus Paceibacterota bacterium]|nr:reverse transcriptase/maturase family protein [Candidatus Paceibacterota bacterium]